MSACIPLPLSQDLNHQHEDPNVMTTRITPAAGGTPVAAES